jgi:hypothetical protein
MCIINCSGACQVAILTHSCPRPPNPLEPKPKTPCSPHPGGGLPSTVRRISSLHHAKLCDGVLSRVALHKTQNLIPLDLALRCFFVFYYMLNPLLQTLVTTGGLFFCVHTAAPRNQGLRMETGSQHTYFCERIVGTA